MRRSRPPPLGSSRRPSTVEPVAAPDGGRQTFAVLLGLDAALAHANPLSRRGRPARPHRVRAPLRGVGPPRLRRPSRRPPAPLRPPGPPRPAARRPGRRLRLGGARQLSRLGRLRSRRPAGPLPPDPAGARSRPPRGHRPDDPRARRAGVGGGGALRAALLPDPSRRSRAHAGAGGEGDRGVG